MTNSTGNIAADRTHPWRNLNVWLLLGGQWVSQMGNVCFTVAVFWYVLAATHSRADLGWVGAASALTGIFSLLTGSWVDRWNRRRTLLAVDTIRGLLLAVTVVLLVVTHHLPLAMILGLVAAVNLGGTLFNPAQFALVPEVVPPEHLTAVNGVDQSATSLSQWVGYAVGGWVMSLIGVVGLIGADAATFVISAVSLLGLRVPKASAESTASSSSADDISLWHQIVTGQRILWSHPFLQRALPTALIVNFSMMTLTVLDVAWARHVLHRGPAVYGLLESAVVVGGIVGGLLVARLPVQWSLRTRVIASLMTTGIAMIGMSVHASFATSIAAMAVVGVAFGVLNTTMNTTIQQVVPNTVLGRIGGALMAVSSVSMPLGSVLAGIAGSLWPLRLVYAVAGTIVAVTSVSFFWIPAEFRAITVAAGETSSV